MSEWCIRVCVQHANFETMFKKYKKKTWPDSEDTTTLILCKSIDVIAFGFLQNEDINQKSLFSRTMRVCVCGAQELCICVTTVLFSSGL